MKIQVEADSEGAQAYLKGAQSGRQRCSVSGRNRAAKNTAIFMRVVMLVKTGFCEAALSSTQPQTAYRCFQPLPMLDLWTKAPTPTQSTQAKNKYYDGTRLLGTQFSANTPTTQEPKAFTSYSKRPSHARGSQATLHHDLERTKLTKPVLFLWENGLFFRESY